jgi:hypothetical protein
MAGVSHGKLPKFAVNGDAIQQQKQKQAGPKPGTGRIAAPSAARTV